PLSHPFLPTAVVVRVLGRRRAGRPGWTARRRATRACAQHRFRIPMQVNVEKISPVLVELSVEIGADRVKTEVEKAFRAVAKTARVKGFRPGKAPRQVLDHVYGARVAADVAQRLIDETYQQAVQEHKVQPVADPALETPRLERGKAYNYKARVEVLPEIEDVKYEGLEAKRPAVQVTDEEVKAELEELRRANSTLETPK